MSPITQVEEKPKTARRDELIERIRKHFGDFLGSDVVLLEQPGGLEVLQRKYWDLYFARYGA